MRLVRIFPAWPNVRLWALEPHDLALTKLERSNDRDFRDVMYLAQAGLIVRETLISRFEKELECGSMCVVRSKLSLGLV